MSDLNTRSKGNRCCAVSGGAANDDQARRGLALIARRPVARLVAIAGTSLISALSPLGARAELKFERTSIDLQQLAGEDKLTGVFTFRNEGDRPATILAVRSSCGCTTAALEKRVYQSGESGEIRVSYSPGNETGERRKTVEVVLDDAERRTIALELRAAIEPVFKSGTRIASWKKGDAIKPREINIEVLRREPLELTSTLSSSDRVEASLVPVEVGRKYKLTIVPKSTADPLKAFITVRGRGENSPALRILALVQ